MDYIDLLKSEKSIIDEQALSELKNQREKFKAEDQALLEKIRSFSFEQSSLTRNDDIHSPVEIKFKASESESQNIEQIAKDLIPWLKGPFTINDMTIDAEWRSDYKWNRLLPKLENLQGKKVLDIGTNNGYFLFQMAKQNPAMVLGIDPVVSNLLQFEFIKRFYPNSPLYFELFGIEHLPHLQNCFDVIFSMGILYHHRHPLEQLLDIKGSLKNGGTLYIETIGIPGEESVALFPEGRYANMRNVWFLPTLSCLKNWLARTGFKEIEVISTEWRGTEEQRLTDWCPPPKQSYSDYLDPNNHKLTIEGHPAPERFLIKAKRRDG
jgi:tRNA (mo5U34)-methyltransferase